MTTLELHWGPSAHARRLLTVAAVAVAVLLVTGRTGILALAAAPLLLLLAPLGSTNRPRAVRLLAGVSPDHCVEGETITLDVEVEARERLGMLRLELTSSRQLRRLDRETPTAVLSNRISGTWAVRVDRWGRRTVGELTVVARDGLGLWEGRGACPVGEVISYPQPAAFSHVAVPHHLPARLGQHLSGRPGHGSEFARTRPYVPGDLPRDVHWPSTLRHGSLHVVQHLAEESADVIVAIDAFTDVGGTLSRSVRGATGVAAPYLRSGDRAGLIVLGGGLHWLPPESGQRTLYRIADEILTVQRDISVVTPDVGRLPRRSLPPAALIVVFTPLLDERIFTLLHDLHDRGTQVLVVDVLTTKPPRAADEDDLALRMWRLDRQATAYRLRDSGIPVFAWDGRRSLDEVLLAPHPALPGGARWPA